MKKRILVLCIILLVIVLLFPVRGKSSDGGSVTYNAVLYEVRLVHTREIGPYGEPERLTKGTIVRILGFEVYNNTKSNYVDSTEQKE